MTEHKIPIPSRIYNAAVGGHVAGADQIIDDKTGLTLDKVAGGALEEKEHISGSNNGMGRIVLRKNIIEGVNTLTQNMINKSNTIYVIQYDFTLGEDITIPENCVFEFDGGSIANGTITGQNSSYIGGNNIFKNILITGTWKVPVINDLSFDASTYVTSINLVKSINALQNEDIFNEIIINRDYIIYYEISTQGQYIIGEGGFVIKSNAKVNVSSTLTVATNNYTHYSIFKLLGSNIEYSGGRLIGDVETHTGTKGEHGYGIELYDAKYITVHDVICEKFWGDGIILVGTESSEYSADKCEYIYIYNVICDYNRRQGLSVCAAHHVVIENSKFTNTGQIKYTSPARGIDIEPNDNDSHKDVCKDIVIRDCKFGNNYYGSIACYSSQIVYNSEILIDNCDLNNDGNITIGGATNVTIRNCKNTGVSFSNLHTDVTQNVSVENSIIKNFSAEGISNGLFDLNISNCTWLGKWSKNNYAIADNIVAKNTIFSSIPINSIWHIKAYDCDLGNLGESTLNGYYELYNCKLQCYKLKLAGDVKIYNCTIDHTYEYGCFVLQTESAETKGGKIIDLRNNTYIKDSINIIFWQIIGDFSETDFIIEQIGTSAQFSTVNDNGFASNFASCVKHLLTWQ